MTIEKVCSFTRIKTIDHFFEGSFFDFVLKLVEKHRNELLDVLLNHQINRLPERFVSQAEPSRNIICPRSKLKVSKNPLELMQDIVVIEFFFVFSQVFWLIIFNSENQVSKVFIHVKLLHHRVDVTNIS